MGSISTKFARFSFRRYFMRLAGRTSRVLALIFVVHGIAMLFMVNSARSDMKEMMVGAGSHILRYARAERQDSARTLSINGQSLSLSVGSTEDSLSDVLDYYETYCQAVDGGLLKQYKSARGPAAPGKKIAATVIREQGDSMGIVACLDSGKDHIGAREWLARIQAFGETGNVSEIGRLRYIYAEAGKERTTFVTLWTEGALNVFDMFPNQGDAPGFDLPDVPRPEHSKRLLSAREHGFSQAVTVYVDPKQQGKELYRYYTTQLPKKGWSLHPSPRNATLPAHAPRTLVAVRGDTMISIVTGTDRSGQGFANVMNMH